MNKKSFFRQIIDIGIGTFITILIGVITTPIITRIVSPSIYGNFALFNTYLTLGLSFVCLGLDQSFIRFFYEVKIVDEKIILLKKCLKIPIIIWAIASVILIILKKTTTIVGLSYFNILCFVTSLLIVFINRFSLNWLRVNDESRLYASLNCLTKLLYVFFAIILIKATQNINQYYILVLANCIATFVPTLIACLMVRKTAKHHIYKAKLPHPTYRELLNYGFPLMISTSVFSIFQATDRLSLNYFCTASIVGVYASAQTLMTVFSIIQQSFNIVWGAKAIEKYEEGSNIESYYIFVHRIMVVCMFTFGATILLFKNVFVLLLGEKYREASTIIPFLMLNPIMYTISETTNLGIIMKKRSMYQVFVGVISCIINLMGNFVLIPIIGAKGAAVSTGISYIIFWGLRTFFSQKLMYIRYGLNRLLIVIGTFCLMAYYHMAYSYLVVEIIIYILFLFLLLVLYKKEIIEMISTLISKFKKILR